MRKTLIAGNWKMNGSQERTALLLDEIKEELPNSLQDSCVVFPPAVYLHLVANRLRNTSICWGGQNVYPANSGAFTGEISGAMLKDLGCQYVLLGHSERRRIFAENEKFIAKKFHHVKEHGMIPLLCVGETLEEREAGQTEHVLTEQLMSIVDDLDTAHLDTVFENCVIAYEPIWAIGTGKAASPEQAQEVHELIRAIISHVNKQTALTIPLCYGGSVTEQNAGFILEMPDVDGLLVGGASLNAKQFVEIAKCIS